MDGVILIAIVLPTVLGLFTFMFQIINGESGTKGITQPYTTKSGMKHTAKKSREQHIV